MTKDAVRPNERFVRVAATIRDERDRLSRVVGEASQALADFAQSEPSMRELRGIGDIVHDFYTGAERIFERVAPELNGGVPAGPAWHREILRSMTLDLPGVRPPLLGKQTERVLDEFLRFRHLFRHSYGFELEWTRLRPLLEQVPAAWAALEADLESFLDFLTRAASSA